MNKKLLILIFVIILTVILVVAGVYLLNNQEKTYTKMNITKSCYLYAPVSNDATNRTDEYNIYYYVDKENDLNITSFNSAEHDFTLEGAAKMANIRDSTLGSKTIQKDNLTISYDEASGVYGIFIGNETSHDNLLITAKDIDVLVKVVNSVVYVEIASEPVQQEVSYNKPPGELIWSNHTQDWMYEDRGADGNMRQYDTQGNLIGSTYDEDQDYLAERYGF